jgi:hypothetical protein
MGNRKDEIKVFNFFKDNYVDFPSGEIIYSDKPDYRIKTAEGLIGIEITEAVINPRDLEKYRFQISLTNDVLHQLQDKLPFTFSIVVKPKQDADLPVKKKRKVVEEVVNLCVKECMFLKEFEHYRVHDFGRTITDFPAEFQEKIFAEGYRNLPEGILEVSIGRYDNAGKSWNCETTGMVVPNFTLDRLRKILKRKESKLEGYTECKEQWLLIWGSGLPESYYDRIEIHETVDTVFDKIFFAQPSEKLTEIKTNASKSL